MKFQSIFTIVVVVILLGCNRNNNSQKEDVVASSEKNVSSSSLSMVTVKGRNLVDEEGNQYQLKGTNIGNWLVPEGYMFKMREVNAPRKINELLTEVVGPDSVNAFWHQYLETYITHEDIKHLKQIGCNHLRLPFHYSLFTDDLYMGKRNAGFEYMDRFMDWCRQENMYVLLDMHCAPGGQTGDNIDDSYGYPFLFRSQSSKDQFVEIWLKIAEKYKGDPVVIGYDLVNEPIAHYFGEEHDELADSLALLYDRTIKEIRKIDPNHTIFLNGSIWASQFGLFEDIAEQHENIVYEFHKYWVPVDNNAIQQYVDFREKYNVPIYVGETGENTDQWVDSFRVMLDTNNIHWAFWPYKKMNNTAGIMNFDEPGEYTAITKYALSNRGSYKKIRENYPNRDSVQTALNKFLENCKFKNCYPNEGYCKALELLPQSSQ